MSAIRLHEFGPAENLRWEEVEDPRPGPGQILVDVEAAGVHLLDTSIRRGVAAGPFPLPELPTIPGREVAGVVAAVGDGVDAGWTGRRVVAHLGQASRGYAERVVTDAARLHALPDGVGAAAAVAMIGTGRTALGVLDAAAVREDDVVLVTGAAGGLGSLLVQGARRAGARVIGAAGGEAKVARVRELGAVGVDYLRPGWERDAGGVTLVLDGVGGTAGRTAFELLEPGGRIVLFGWSSGSPTEVTTADLLARSLGASAATGSAHPAAAARAGGAGARRSRRRRARAGARSALLARPCRRGARCAGGAEHGREGGPRALSAYILI